MAISAYDWNVVIAGSWNRAILTPQGIGKFVFGLTDSTSLQLELSINSIDPPRVTYDDVSVRVFSNRIILDCATCSDVNMDKSLRYGRTSLSQLIYTPVQAAGFNFRYRFRDSGTIDLTKSLMQSTNYMSKYDYTPVSSNVIRAIKYEAGTLNIQTDWEGDDKFALLFNFHFNSLQPESLQSWLNPNFTDIRSTIDNIKAELLNGLDQETDEDE